MTNRQLLERVMTTPLTTAFVLASGMLSANVSFAAPTAAPTISPHAVRVTSSVGERSLTPIIQSHRQVAPQLGAPDNTVNEKEPRASIRTIGANEIPLLEALPQPPLHAKYSDVAVGENAVSTKSAAWRGVDAVALDIDLATLERYPKAEQALRRWVYGGGVVLLYTDAAQLFGYETTQARERTETLAGQLFGRARAKLPFGAHPLLWGARSKSLEGQTTGLMGVQLVFYRMEPGDHLVDAHNAGVPLLHVTDLAMPDGRIQYASAMAPQQRGWAIFLPRRIETHRADGAQFLANLHRFLVNRAHWTGVPLKSIQTAFAEATPQPWQTPQVVQPGMDTQYANPQSLGGGNFKGSQGNMQNVPDQALMASNDVLPNVDWDALSLALAKAARGEPAIAVMQTEDEEDDVTETQERSNWEQHAVLLMTREEAINLAEAMDSTAQQMHALANNNARRGNRRNNTGRPLNDVARQKIYSSLALLLNIEARRVLQDAPQGKLLSPLMAQVLAAVPMRRQWMAQSVAEQRTHSARISLWNGIFATAAAQVWGQHAVGQRALMEEAVFWWSHVQENPGS